MRNLSPPALALYQAHGPGPVDWERMVKIVDNLIAMAQPVWLPIETALDGDVLLWAHGRQWTGERTIHGWCSDGTFIQPSHWMPFPTPPADREKTGETGV